MIELTADMLGGTTARLLRLHGDALSEIRLRADRPARLRRLDGTEISGDPICARDLQRILNRLMENSLYAREEELRQGYFTAADGSRVGVCGKINAGQCGVESLANIGSACIRIPREARGCAGELFSQLYGDGLASLLILSPPGMGKTTLIRDLARMLSDDGWNVAIADERREIAACREGVPQLDVGSRTDVLDGCPKALGLPMLVRSCAPDLIIADEIGGEGDVQAILDAARCGVRIVATAHASSLREAVRRRQIADLLQGNIFDWCALLGPRPGMIRQIQSMREGEGFQDAQGCAAVRDSAGVRGRGKNDVQCAQT